MTFYLYARPSFLEGPARLFDFGNTLFEYNYSMTPEQADYFATLSDWRAVGQDIQAILDRMERERRLDAEKTAAPAAR